MNGYLRGCRIKCPNHLALTAYVYEKALLLVFFPAFFFSRMFFAQRIIWSENSNNRIRSGLLGPSTVTAPTDFITGLVSPRNIKVDQINNRLYYHNHGLEDVLVANLTTGAPISTLVSSGSMAGYYDFSFSDNAGVVFATGIYEVQGVFALPTNGDPDYPVNLDRTTTMYSTRSRG